MKDSQGRDGTEVTRRAIRNEVILSIHTRIRVRYSTPFPVLNAGRSSYLWTRTEGIERIDLRRRLTFVGVCKPPGLMMN